MKYVFLGMGLLLLTGCGGSSDSGGSPDLGGLNDSPSLSGDATFAELKNSAVTVDGYEQVTIAPDADVQVTLKSGEVFALNSGSTAEKMVVQGKLTITSN